MRHESRAAESSTVAATERPDYLGRFGPNYRDPVAVIGCDFDYGQLTGTWAAVAPDWVGGLRSSGGGIRCDPLDRDPLSRDTILCRGENRCVVSAAPFNSTRPDPKYRHRSEITSP